MQLIMQQKHHGKINRYTSALLVNNNTAACTIPKTWITIPLLIFCPIIV